jgi:hypothetical protein
LNKIWLEFKVVTEKWICKGKKNWKKEWVVKVEIVVND